MGKPHSDDLRRGVAQAIETGHTYEEAADLCGVSISSVSRWRRTGRVSPHKFGGYKRYALEPYRRQIERWVGAQRHHTVRNSSSLGPTKSGGQPDRDLPLPTSSRIHS